MYDPEREMIFSFGGKGEQVGTFNTPSAIDHWKDRVYVLDSGNQSITVFSPTEYGRTVIEALKLYLDGQYEKSQALWEDVLRMNGNEFTAYIGIGKSLLYSKKYREAMLYFKKGNSRFYESRAFELYRADILRRLFPYAVIGLFTAAVGGTTAFVVFRAVRRKKGEKRS